MKDYYRLLGDSIKEVRIARGLSQGQLARRLGVSKSKVSKWERGVVKPTPYDMDMIAVALTCTTDVFYHVQRLDNSADGRLRALRAIDAMDERQREIMWHFFTRWDGDKAAFFELTNLYMRLDKQSRSDVVAFTLLQFERSQDAEALGGDMPKSDAEYVKLRLRKFLVR